MTFLSSTMKTCFLELRLLALLAGVTLGTGAFWGGSEEICTTQISYPGTPSDIYVTGLLGLHGDGQCAILDPTGIQLMEAARWSANKFTELSLIPGSVLGVNMYDTCGGSEAAFRAGVAAVVESGYLDPPECQTQTHVGVLHTHPDNDLLAKFLQDVSVPSVIVSEADLTPQLDAVMPLLQRLNWTTVSVAAPSIKTLKSFGQFAADAGLCVTAEGILPETTSKEHEFLDLLKVLDRGTSGGVVLIGPQHTLRATLTTAAAYNFTRFDLILLPTGPIQNHLFQGLNNVGSSLLAVRRESQSVPEFGEYFTIIASGDSTLHPHFSPEEYVEEPGVFQIVEAMYVVGVSLRRTIMQDCGGSGWCKNASAEFADPHDDDLDVIEALSIKAQRPSYQVLRLTSDENSILSFTKVGSFSAGILELEESVTEGPNGIPSHPCLSCSCLNFRFSFLIDLRWRSDSWVTICITMAILGFLIAIAVAVFLLAMRGAITWYYNPSLPMTVLKA